MKFKGNVLCLCSIKTNQVEGGITPVADGGLGGFGRLRTPDPTGQRPEPGFDVENYM